MEFSKRTPGDLSLNLISKTIENIPSESLLDLTLSNPTKCDFKYPSNLLKVLGSESGLKYEPIPFGNLNARTEVSNYLKKKGKNFNVNNILLASSTSEAYSYLFKLIGNPGDSFLVPSPGYPLLEHLLQMEGLQMEIYELKTEPHWSINWNDLDYFKNNKTKGLVVVNPNNPTGSYISKVDQEKLFDFCQVHDLAYISDEVFEDFIYPNEVIEPMGSEKILTFRLGGLSKSLGLPQLKLSWILMEGPEVLLKECRERLELIADTYLSVNTPVQLGLHDLFQFAPDIQNQIMQRIITNREILKEILEPLKGIRIWPAQGGWYALLEILGGEKKDEEWVIELIEKKRVFVQPGSFYDFRKGCFLVLSLLPPNEFFRNGIRSIYECLKSKGL